MHSDFNLDSGGINELHSTTRKLLTDELRQLRKRMKIIPFPFCELECPWLPICRIKQPLECVISVIREANQEYTDLNTKIDSIQYFWH